jgi:glycine cleavage system aminomethyltransferase T
LHPLGFDIVGPNETIANAKTNLLARGASSMEEAALEAIRIESGWPRWGHEMDETRFVVELGRIAKCAIMLDTHFAKPDTIPRSTL